MLVTNVVMVGEVVIVEIGDVMGFFQKKFS
jgi:hypothetical protein